MNYNQEFEGGKSTCCVKHIVLLQSGNDSGIEFQKLGCLATRVEPVLSGKHNCHRVERMRN